MLTVFACRAHTHPLSLAKHLQLRTCQVWELEVRALEVRAYPPVHDAPVASPPPRKSPFKNRPSWAIRKPTPGVLQPSVEPVQQPTALGDAIDIST